MGRALRHHPGLRRCRRVRYCRIQNGGYNLVGNSPLDYKQARKAYGRSVRIYDEILAHLSSRGFCVERATVAAFASLVLMNGSASFLRPEPSDGSGQQGKQSCRVQSTDGTH